MTEKKGNHIKRVGVVFSGGPAPAANAVISSAAISFIEDGREVIGFFHGYSELQDYHPVTHRLLPDEHYRIFAEKDLSGLRNTRGIVIGTARANPGKGIDNPKDLEDPAKTVRLRNVYNALVDLEVDALISIGGDDTLKTANFLYEYQKRLPKEARRFHVVHLPKTIDNDYRGIDFTFGFFTAVDVMAKELQNLRADAIATSSYFIVETMGRKAGWLSYGVAIAGEANLVLAVEDVQGSLAVPGGKTDEPRLSLDALVDRIVDLIATRERRGKHYGTVVLAEGLAEMLPPEQIKDLPRDEHGHLSLGRIDLGKLVAQLVQKRYEQKTGQKKKCTGLQLGYESRCAPPHAFDVMLGSQLGIGAYRALVEENLDGHMVSVTGQLDLSYVPFHTLVNPQNLKTEVRFIKTAATITASRASSRRAPTGSWTGRRAADRSDSAQRACDARHRALKSLIGRRRTWHQRCTDAAAVRCICVLAVLAMSACYSPSVRDCTVSCASETDCEYGQSCRDGFCTASASCGDPAAPADATNATSDATRSACEVGCTNGTCVDGVCVIDCSAPDSCRGSDIKCLPNLPCKVICGDRSCEKKVLCEQAASCEVVCSGTDACGDEIICTPGHPCTVTCSGPESCAKKVKCKEACACDVTCTGSGSCAETPECPMLTTCQLGGGCSSQLPGCDRCD